MQIFVNRILGNYFISLCHPLIRNFSKNVPLSKILPSCLPMLFRKVCKKSVCTDKKTKPQRNRWWDDGFSSEICDALSVGFSTDRDCISLSLDTGRLLKADLTSLFIVRREIAALFFHFRCKVVWPAYKAYTTVCNIEDDRFEMKKCSLNPRRRLLVCDIAPPSAKISKHILVVHLLKIRYRNGQ